MDHACFHGHKHIKTGILSLSRGFWDSTQIALWDCLNDFQGSPPSSSCCGEAIVVIRRILILSGIAFFAGHC